MYTNLTNIDTLVKYSSSAVLFYMYSRGGHYIAVQRIGAKFVAYNVYNGDRGPIIINQGLKKCLRDNSFRGVALITLYSRYRANYI